MSLADSIRSVLEIDPGAVAMEFEGHSLSWANFAGLIGEIDASLTRAGIGKGAPIGLLLRNRPEMVGAILAIIASERCIVCVNPLQGDKKLAADLESIRVPALLACEEDWQAASMRDAAAKVGSMGLALRGVGAGSVHAVAGLKAPVGGPHRSLAPGVAVEMLTSGTTGAPKRVELRSSAFEQSILGASHYESNRPEQPTLKQGFALVTSPLVHISGIFHCVKAAVDGRRLCLLERFAVEAWTEAVRRHRPKATGLVPSAMKMVLDANVAEEDLASLRAVTSGTAPLSPELQSAFEERYGIPVLVTYGATEFAGAVAGWTIHDHREFAARKLGSVGRAHPGCELRIVDPKSGEVLAADKTGLLEVRSGQATMRGWVRTADVARLDADGFLFIEGRADGAINRGGFKIDPAHVARALERHPAIREAAVVGLPDERLGEVPAAVFELCEGATAPSEQELVDFARAHLTRYHVPTRWKVVEQLPRTPALKPSMPGLRALFGAEESAK